MLSWLKGLFVLENLSDLGSWASIISFFFTGFSAYVLYKVKGRFLFRTNMEQNCKDLDSRTEELASLLSNYFQNKDEILELFARIDVILRDLQKGASDNFLKDIKKCRKEIAKYSKENSHQNESKVRLIKTALTVIYDESNIVKKSLIVG